MPSSQVRGRCAALWYTWLIVSAIRGSARTRTVQLLQLTSQVVTATAVGTTWEQRTYPLQFEDGYTTIGNPNNNYNDPFAC